MTAPGFSKDGPDEESDNVTELPVASAPPPPMPPELKDALKDSVRLGLVGRSQIWLMAQLWNLPFLLGKAGRRTPLWLWWAVRDPLIGLARVAIVSFNWLHMTEERNAIRQMESKDSRAGAKRAVNKDGRFRYIVVAVLAGIVLLGHIALWWFNYTNWLTLETLGVYGLLVWLGHKPKKDADGPVRRRGPLTHGTSSRSLRRDLEEGFTAKKMPEVGIIGLTVNKYGWHGIIETELPIDDKLIEHLERWVHAPAGGLLLTTDERNSAAHPFKLLIEDPLLQPSVPELPQEPRDIRRMAKIGRHLFGQDLMVNLRQHIGLIGRSGSGKSSGFWILIDWVTSCTNAEADGGDLSQGPALPAWRRAMRRVGTTPEEIQSILEEGIALALERNAELSRMAEDDDDDSDENWDPTPQHKARYIFLDEFHLIADDKVLLALVKTLIRIGRKACIYLVIGTPGASKEDLGSVILKGMIGLKIIFSCIQQDVTNFLGGKMIENGWRPDKLKPAAADNEPRDAGKAFVWDGDHQQPEVVRISRLSLGDCKRRARSRASVALLSDAEVTERPTALTLLEDCLDSYSLDKVSIGWLDKFLTTSDSEWGIDRMQAELKALGVTPSSVNKGPWKEANPRGYKRSDTAWPQA